MLLYQIVYFNLVYAYADIYIYADIAHTYGFTGSASLKLSTNALHDNVIKSGNWIF